MTVKTAYLAFMADSPMIGLNPQPSWAPEDSIKSYDADGYITALGAYTDRASLEAEINQDYEARLQAVEDGDMEDADDVDDIFEVAVHDDGRIEVIHETPRYTFAEFTIAQVYDAYGMDMPKAAA
jgi:hypothetical protein